MGAVGGMLGLSGGAGGTGFSTTNPVSGAQLSQAGTNTQSAIDQQQALLNAIQAQNGLGNQTQVYNQLQDVANGTGPNPAQAMLNQATGANVANQAALMAGQRGAAGNVGLMARQAAQQGANIQQNAVGQGATMEANQSLNALNSAGNMANTQAGNQLSASQNLANTSLGNQQAVYNAQTGYNTAQAGLAQTTMGNQMKTIGGLSNSIGGALHLPGAAKAEGGLITTGPQSHFGMYAAGGAIMPQPAQVPALVSPGERYLPPQEVQKVAEGKKSAINAGEKIPGEAKVKGAKNSYANDTVPKTLEEGGIVLPRSVTQAKDAPKKAAEFVAAIMKKQAMEGKKKNG